MDASEIAVVIAARDEADRIGETVHAVREAFPARVVVVADDGSADATADVARAAGAEVVRLPRAARARAGPRRSRPSARSRTSRS